MLYFWTLMLGPMMIIILLVASTADLKYPSALPHLSQVFSSACLRIFVGEMHRIKARKALERYQ
jgi:hypothetical protein